MTAGIQTNNEERIKESEWELERGRVKGDNLSKTFRIQELEAENKRLREGYENIQDLRSSERMREFAKDMVEEFLERRGE